MRLFQNPDIYIVWDSESWFEIFAIPISHFSFGGRSEKGDFCNSTTHPMVETVNVRTQRSQCSCSRHEHPILEEICQGKLVSSCYLHPHDHPQRGYEMPQGEFAVPAHESCREGTAAESFLRSVEGLSPICESASATASAARP